MSDINKIMEAYLGMVSAPQVEETLDEAVNMGPWNRGAINKAMAKAGIKGPQAKAFIAALRVSGTVAEEVEEELDEACGKKHYKEEREECPKCEGEGCDHCDGKGYHEIEEKKLDPVDDAENDKKFKNRKDKDIDNDGDVDSSDEYLHKRRKATDDAIDGGKKPAKEEVEKDEEESEEEPKKKKSPVPPKKDDGEEESEEPAPESDDEEEEEKPEPEGGDSKLKKNPKTADKKAEISKIETKEAFEAFWAALVEATQKSAKGETPEDSTTPDTKRAQDMHKGKSDKKIEDMEDESHDSVSKAGKPTKKAPEPK